MSVAKVAISMNERTLHRLDSLVRARIYRTRSEAIQKFVEEKLGRMEKSRLACECAKLRSSEERAIAEEGLGNDAKEWPAY